MIVKVIVVVLVTVSGVVRDLDRAVDAGYPGNTDLLLEGGRPVLRRRKGAERRPSALALEAAIQERVPQRALLDILTRTAYLLRWHRRFGPASGSDPFRHPPLAPLDRAIRARPVALIFLSSRAGRTMS